MDASILTTPLLGDKVYNVGNDEIPQSVVDCFEVKRFSVLGWIKFFLGFFTVFPVKLIITIFSCICIFFDYLIFFCCIGPADVPQPLIIRCAAVSLGWMFTRLNMLLYGYFWVTEHGKPNKSTKMYISNHSSCLDMFFHIYKFCPAFVVGEFVTNSAFLSPLSSVLNCLHIDRKSRGNSSLFLERLKNRLTINPEKRSFPVCVIFPEGGTSNGSHLNYFHSGAFIPGEPIQPIILRYNDKINPTTWSVRSWPFHFCTMMVQFTNHLEVFYLPLYYPSQAEIEHPRLYANNLRNVMAHAAHMPLSEFTFADRKRYEAARKDEEKKKRSERKALPQPIEQAVIYQRQNREVESFKKRYESAVDISLPPYSIASSSSSSSSPSSLPLAPTLTPSALASTSLPPATLASLLLPVDPDSYDTRLATYHSRQPLPPPAVLAALESNAASTWGKERGLKGQQQGQGQGGGASSLSSGSSGGGGGPVYDEHVPSISNGGDNNGGGCSSYHVLPDDNTRMENSSSSGGAGQEDSSTRGFAGDVSSSSSSSSVDGEFTSAFGSNTSSGGIVEDG